MWLLLWIAALFSAVTASAHFINAAWHYDSAGVALWFFSITLTVLAIEVSSRRMKRSRQVT